MSLKSRIKSDIENKKRWDLLLSKSVRATSFISIDVHCPYCDHYQDRNEELRQELPRDSMSVEDIEVVLKCDNCQREILIKAIDY